MLLITGIFVVLACAYAVAEIYNYMNYKQLLKSITPIKNCEFEDDKHMYDIKENIKDSLLTKEYNLKTFIKQITYNKLELEDIPRKCITDSLGSMIFMKKNISHNKINEIEEFVDKVEQKIGTKFSVVDNDVPHIIWGQETILPWYQPLFFRGIKFLVRKCFNIYLYNIGFKKYRDPNGYVIWHRINNNASETPLVLFHCSIAGVMTYSRIINLLIKDRTVILPEVPGISWDNHVTCPPGIREMTRILNNKLHEWNIGKHDIISHSFGGVVAISYMHKYSQQVKKCVFVEVGVFVSHVLQIYCELNDLTNVYQGKNLDISSMLTNIMLIPVFHRDPYILYYLNREVWLKDSSLFGLECTDRNEETHIIMSENDDKFHVKAYEYYLQNNDLKYKWKTFKDRFHGAFCHDREMQDYVLSIVVN
jgi:pimeloyl-ACP methyl ester carboxylesterase